MTTRPHLVVSDLDGTLLGPGGVLTPGTVEVLHKAAAAGVPVMFATGRPTRWFGVLEGVPTLWPYVVGANGAFLYDLAERTMLWTNPLDSGVLADAVGTLGEAIPGVGLAFEYGDELGLAPSYSISHAHDTVHLVAHPEELVGRAPVLKLLVQKPDWSTERLAEVVEPLVGDRMSVTFSSPFGLLELAAPGVSKGETMRRLVAEWGVDAADVVAFGDMPNDLDMLQWAGRGYAMGNAHASLLAAGLPTVGHHGDDAVAAKIAELLELPAGRPAPTFARPAPSLP